MIKGVKIKQLARLGDERGWLAEIFRQDETDYRPMMSYVSQTKPGVVRGPHEHLKQHDFFVFLVGQFRLHLWDNREGAENYRQLEIFEVRENNPCSVLVPPGVVHAYQCISEQPGLVINLPDQLYQGAGKKNEADEVRWEGREDSPFRII